MVVRMSRLIDKLKCTCQVEPQPMGFIAARASSEKPRMQLIAFLAAGNPAQLSGQLAQADAALVKISRVDDLDELEKLSQIKDGIPSGGWLTSTAGSILKKISSPACDFMVFPDNTPLTAITRKDKSGRILELDLALSEGWLRTANDLPVEAVLIAGKGAENALTLNRLMLIQRVAYLISKPLLVSLPVTSGEAELQAVWDIGISGVVVEVDANSMEKLAEVRKAIDSLAPSASRKKDRMRAILPSLKAEVEKPEEEEEEEEDE